MARPAIALHVKLLNLIVFSGPPCRIRCSLAADSRRGLSLSRRLQMLNVIGVTSE